jgi:hypothetical protein
MFSHATTMISAGIVHWLRCCYVAAFIFGVALFAPGQITSPEDVSDCQPCTIRIAPQGPVYSFFFNVRLNPDGRRVVPSIRVVRDNSEVQELKVHDMMPMPAKKKFFFGGVDINFDGFQDLEILTSRGAANASADYWIFKPDTGKFDYLGNYPIFTIDAEKHRLKTYERGGYGGMVYTSSEYAFVDGKLELTRCEKQEATAQENVFSRVVQERVNGELKVTQRETVSGKTAQDQK